MNDLRLLVTMAAQRRLVVSLALLVSRTDLGLIRNQLPTASIDRSIVGSIHKEVISCAAAAANAMVIDSATSNKTCLPQQINNTSLC